MRYIILTIGLIGFAGISFAQNLSSSVTAEKIEDLVSTNDYDELNPIYSAEGNVLYFSRLDHAENNFGKKNSQDIWSSDLQKDSSWSTPERLKGEINNSQYNNALAVFDEGTAILVSGRYTKKGNWYDRGLTIFKRSEGKEWHISQEINVPKFRNINDGDIMKATLKNGVLVVSASKSFRGTNNKLYISRQKENGRWSKLKKLKMSGFENGDNYYAPRLTTKADTLFFASNDGHDLNIYYVNLIQLLDKKGKDSVAFYPANEINTKHNEQFISLNDDGEIAFFSSDRDGTWDIYKVRRFENERYVKYYGKLVNQYKNDVLDQKYHGKLNLLEVSADGDTTDYEPLMLSFDSTSGEFEFQVPFGKQIVAFGSADNFDSDTTVLDTRGKYEYEEHNRDLFLKPIMFADLKGQILDSATNQPLEIPENVVPTVYVNDNSYPKASIDSSMTFDDVRLALGYEYDLAIVIDGYDSIPVKLDLTNQDSYKDTTINLYVRKKPDPYFHVKFELYSSADSFEIKADRKVMAHGEVLDDSTKGKSYFYLNTTSGGETPVKIHVHGYEDYIDTLSLGFVQGQDSVVKLYLNPLVEGYHMVMDNVHFETRKSDLTPDSYRALDELVAFLDEYPTMVIEIDGHTDNVGTEKYNQKLSENRAKSVKQYLLSKGVSEERIEAKGFGFSKPIVPNDSDENRAKNRRVEFTILKAE